MGTPFHEAAVRRLGSIDSAGRRRSVRELADSSPHTRDRLGNSVLNFASNDYLGLAADPRVSEAAAAAAREFGAGAGSARLITGGRAVHRELEEDLAAAHGTEAALLFPTGYMANLAVATALAALGDPDRRVRMYSDELNHASIIDGIRLGRAECVVYPHVNLPRALDAGGEHAGPSEPLEVVLTDAVFSMDGDLAPLAELARVCAERAAVLVVDEAHLVFEVPDWPPAVTAGTATDLAPDLIRVGTLSKALGSQGGFVAGERWLIDLLVNVARPFIFTTAVAPPVAGAARCALAIAQSEEGEQRRSHLRGLIDMVKPGHPSPIVPIFVGDERAAMAASARLYEAGLFVPAIRPPTVAPGTSRLRISLSAAHTEADVEALLTVLDTLDIPW